jgi:hypothetical protein
VSWCHGPPGWLRLQGERLRLLHPAGHAPDSHIDVPVLIAAGGPKGAGVAHEVGDGLFAAMPLPEVVAEFAWTSFQVGGTVLRPGEALDTPRVRETAGPTNAFAYHARYEFGGDVTELPAGQTWLDVINRTEERDRHPRSTNVTSWASTPPTRRHGRGDRPVGRSRHATPHGSRSRQARRALRRTGGSFRIAWCAVLSPVVVRVFCAGCR